MEGRIIQVSIESLQGKWEHSLGLGIITVRGDVVFTNLQRPFPDKLQVTPEGEVAMGKWTTLSSQSSASTIEWRCDGAKGTPTALQWNFEGDASEAEDAEDAKEANGASGAAESGTGKRNVSPSPPTRRVRTRTLRPVSNRKRAEIVDLISQCEASELERSSLIERLNGTEQVASQETAVEPSPSDHVAPRSLAEAQARLSDNKLPAAEVLRLMGFLGDQSVDAQTMVDTRIPQTVTAVRKRLANDPAIESAAKQLLAKWRLLFQEAEQQRSKQAI